MNEEICIYFLCNTDEETLKSFFYNNFDKKKLELILLTTTRAIFLKDVKELARQGLSYDENNDSK